MGKKVRSSEAAEVEADEENRNMPVVQGDLDESVAEVEADEENRNMPVVQKDLDESVAEVEADEENNLRTKCQGCQGCCLLLQA